MPNVSVSASIPIEDWQQIDRLVRQGKYKSMSEYIREVIQRHLKETEK